MRPIDLSKVMVRSKNMLDPEITLKWNSYKAQTTSLGGRLLVEVAVESGKTSEKPDLLELADTTEDPTDDLTDIIAKPTGIKNGATVAVKWPAKGREATVDLQRLLLARRFTVPHGHKAYIPISKKGEGPEAVLVLHFSRARFAQIDPRRTKSKKQGSSASTQQTVTPQPAPAASAEPVQKAQ